MDWSQITRKETVMKQNERTITNAAGIRTTRLKLDLQSSIEETQMFSGRDANERNPSRNRSSSRNFGAGVNLQQGRQDILNPVEFCILFPDFEVGNVNAGGENQETGSNNRSSIIAEAVTANENSTSELDNSLKDIEINNSVCRASTSNDNIYSNSILSTATSIKVYKADEAVKSPAKGISSIEKINNGAEENLAEIERKIKSNGHEPCFANMPQDEENLLKYRSEVNISSGSDIFKSLGFSADARANNDYGNSKKIKNNKKRYQHEKISSSKVENIKDNIKSSHLLHSKMETKRNGMDAASKSVTDLIFYFENLNSSCNKSSVLLPNQKKSKIKLPTFKKDLNDKLSINVNIAVKSNDNISLSAQKIPEKEICSTERPAEIRKELDQPFLGSSIRQNLEKKDEVLIRSPRRKEKRLHCEENKTHSENDSKKIKEHIFIINDGMPNETGYLKTPCSRRYRSRFTRKNNKNRPLSESHDTRNHAGDPSNIRMTKNGILFTNTNSNESNIISTISNENSIPWKQNEINKQGHETNNSVFKKKPKASENGRNMIGFFGIFLTVMFLGIIHKVISDCF